MKGNVCAAKQPGPARPCPEPSYTFLLYSNSSLLLTTLLYFTLLCSIICYSILRCSILPLSQGTLRSIARTAHDRAAVCTQSHPSPAPQLLKKRGLFRQVDITFRDFGREVSHVSFRKHNQHIGLSVTHFGCKSSDYGLLIRKVLIRQEALAGLPAPGCTRVCVGHVGTGKGTHVLYGELTIISQTILSNNPWRFKQQINFTPQACWLLDARAYVLDVYSALQNTWHSPRRPPFCVKLCYYLLKHNTILPCRVCRHILKPCN